LGLIALFTHMHIFWIAALLLALIDLPDFGTPLNRIAGSAEKLAGIPPGQGVTEVSPESAVGHKPEHHGAESSPEAGAKRPDGGSGTPARRELASTVEKGPLHA
jgi:hypothetical protein